MAILFAVMLVALALFLIAIAALGLAYWVWRTA